VTRALTLLGALYAGAMLALGWYLHGASDATPAGMLLAFAPRWALVLPWLVLLVVAWFRSKALVVAFVVAAAATALTVAGFEVPSTAQSDRHALRVVTYNTDGSREMAGRIASDLVAWDADVVVFQDCPGRLAEALRKTKAGQVKAINELCLISRLPIRHFEPMEMPRWDDRRTRAVRVDVDAPGGLVTVVGVHFPSPRTALNAARLRNFRLLSRSIEHRARISREVRDWSARSPHPVIVAGDFNMPHGSALLRRDWRAWRNAFSESGWGFGHTMRVGPFSVRIDHVLLPSLLVAERAQVLSGYPSEHQPLVVDVGWSRE